MNRTHLLATLLVSCYLVSGCCVSTNPSVNQGRNVQPVSGRSHVSNQGDLKWLVGRWKCITRQYIAEPYRPSGSTSADFLEYFNVYLPYADDQLTLKLTEDPEERRIAAEFLVRHVVPFSKVFEEVVTPMSPHSTVRIGSSHIRVGGPTDLFQFKYHRLPDTDPPQLVLESWHTRIVLEKLFYGGNMLIDLTNSFVIAPVKGYSAERLMELNRRYDELRALNVKEPR